MKTPPVWYAYNRKMTNDYNRNVYTTINEATAFENEVFASAVCREL